MFYLWRISITASILDSEGGSCPHQLPTLVTFGQGGHLHPPVPTPRLGSQGPEHVCQGQFPGGKTGLAASSQVTAAVPSPAQAAVMLLQLPRDHLSLDKVPAQCHKSPGSSLHQQSYNTEAKKVRITYFVPIITFISPSFAYRNCHDSAVLPEHHSLTAAKP